jgi:hypothetical protein
VYRNRVTEFSVKILDADWNCTTLPLNFGGFYTVGNDLSLTQILLVFYKLLMKTMIVTI